MKSITKHFHFCQAFLVCIQLKPAQIKDKKTSGSVIYRLLWNPRIERGVNFRLMQWNLKVGMLGKTKGISISYIIGEPHTPYIYNSVHPFLFFQWYREKVFFRRWFGPYPTVLSVYFLLSDQGHSWCCSRTIICNAWDWTGVNCIQEKC